MIFDEQRQRKLRQGSMNFHCATMGSVSCGRVANKFNKMGIHVRASWGGGVSILKALNALVLAAMRVCLN